MDRRSFAATAALAGMTGLTSRLIGTPTPAIAAAPDVTPKGLPWTVVPVAADSTFLNAIDSTTSGTWAVGSRLIDDFVQRQPLIARWQQGRWRTVAQPIRTNATLQAVAVVGAKDAWAVGAEFFDGEPAPLVLRWNGATWNRVSAPLSRADFSQLKVGSDGSVWIGGRGEIDGVMRAVVYRIRGDRWTLLGAGLEQTVNVNGLLVRNPNDVWAALFPGLAHFDGRRWRLAEEFPTDGVDVLTGLTADRSGQLWACGVAGSTSGNPQLPGVTPLALRFTGSRWTRVDTPTPSAQMYGIVATPSGLIAVGEKFSNDGDFILSRPYVLQSTASGFRQIKAPTASLGVLTAASSSHDRLWAVGATTDRTAWHAFSASAPVH